MKAIEFEATTYQHTIRVPDNIPDGVSLRVLLLVDDNKISNDSDAAKHWKNLLAAMPDLGDDEDFLRPLDYGREQS
ncbi:MAG: hypothetical protein ABL925_01715 [Methylococcales bacterium]